jgi:Holliday junction resolvasome RuvABC ATP-dependent DNA helicase subunit
MKTPKKEKDIFHMFVGQERPKKKLNYLYDIWKSTGIYPNTMFIAPRGHGKTAFATALGQQMQKHKRKKIFRPKTASSWKNLEQFMNDVISRDVMGGDCTILIDECHELPMDVQTAMLTMLADNKSNRNIFSWGDIDVPIDFKRHTFFFATTEPHKVFHALMNRLDRVDLEDYTNSQLAEIIKVSIPKAKFEKGVLNEISSTLRDNPRMAVQIGNRIFDYLVAKKKKTFTLPDWKFLSDRLNINLLGLTLTEIRLLDALSEGVEFSLTHLSSKLEMQAAAVRANLELFLLKKNLIQIKATGRSLTSKGKEYLEEHDKVRR